MWNNNEPGKSLFSINTWENFSLFDWKNCKNANMDKKNYQVIWLISCFSFFLILLCVVAIKFLALNDAQVTSKGAFAEREPTKEWSEGNNPVKIGTVIFPDKPDVLVSWP